MNTEPAELAHNLALRLTKDLQFDTYLQVHAD